MKNTTSTERRSFFGLFGAATVSVLAFKFFPFKKSLTRSEGENVAKSRKAGVNLHPLAVKRDSRSSNHGGINE